MTSSVKNILITEPVNPVLRRLAMQFLHDPELAVVCFDREDGGDKERLLRMLSVTEQGHFQFKDCEENIPVDEIWHTANSADSVEECSNKMQRVLLFASRQKNPILHYVSASTAAVPRPEPFSDERPQYNNEGQKHQWNETAVEQSGCKFRIYRLPLSPEVLFHPASGWTQFVQYLIRFKSEIEDRIPGYFTAQPLRLHLPKGGIIDIADINDIADTIQQISRNGMDDPYFHIHTQPPLLVKDCLRALAESIGMRLQIMPNREQQNYVDRLFGLRIENVLRQLEGSDEVSHEMAQVNSSAGQAWFSIPPISLQAVVATCHPRPQSSSGEPAGRKSGLEQKQVLLPHGEILNYYAGGEGPETVVLLNAYGQSFRYWERYVQAVSRRFRIIVWIPRGNDEDTVGLKAASSQEAHADDLEKVLRQEQVETCILLAWCSGPKLALEFYQRYPDRVSLMVFVAASFKGLQQHKALETEYEKNLESLLEAIERYPETAEVVLEYLKGTLLGKQARSVDELAAISDHDLRQALSAVNVSLQELVLHPFHAANVVAYAKQMRYFWSHDFGAALDKVRVPVLFIGGDCDQIASPAIAKTVAGMIPGAKYLEIQGGTHYIHYDQWDLLAEITGQIVKSSDRLKFNIPRADMAELNQEPITARQS